MSAIKDVYDIIKELLSLAKAAENQEMASLVVQIQEKYFDIREEIEDIKNENRNLKDTIAKIQSYEEIEKDLELTEQGYYIRKSEREQRKKHMYCPACWQKLHKLMPLISPDEFWCICSNCDKRIVAHENAGKNLIQVL